MDYYVIISHDIADSADGRARLQETHRKRLEDLQAENRLLTAGPLPKTDGFNQVIDGCQGSLVVAAFDSLESARQWANVDPYYTEGIYVETRVYPYRNVFPTQS